MNTGKTEMVTNLGGIGKMVSSRWAQGAGGCAEGQRIRKARGRSSEGEGDCDKAGTNAKAWPSP